MIVVLALVLVAWLFSGAVLLVVVSIMSPFGLDPDETLVVLQWFAWWALGVIGLSVALWWTYRRTTPH